jgi:hypothetical protein
MTYPPKQGARVKFLGTSDQFTTMPIGTEGTVSYVDSLGTLHVKWDNGSRLGLIPGEDQYEVISQ